MDIVYELATPLNEHDKTNVKPNKCKKFSLALSAVNKLLCMVFMITLIYFLPKINSLINKGELFFDKTVPEELDSFNDMISRYYTVLLDVQTGFGGAFTKMNLILDEVENKKIVDLMQIYISNMNNVELILLDILKKIDKK